VGDWQDWQTNLARASLAVDAGGRLARGRLHGNVAPCCRSLTRYAVLGQAKNRSPVHLLARFRTRRHEMFMASAGISTACWTSVNVCRGCFRQREVSGRTDVCLPAPRITSRVCQMHVDNGV
jgi:hypothetical protein